MVNFQWPESGISIQSAKYMSTPGNMTDVNVSRSQHSRTIPLSIPR